MSIALVRGPSATLPVCTADRDHGTCPTANVSRRWDTRLYRDSLRHAGETKTSVTTSTAQPFDIGDFGQLRAQLNYTILPI